MTYEFIMKIISTCLLLVSFSVSAAKINVPGDFPGTFSMQLLVGKIYIGPAISGDIIPGENGGNILFDADAFDNIGAGAGTSALTLIAGEKTHIATSLIAYTPAEFYIDGSGTGTLVDNADSTAGHWTLKIPLYVTFNDYEYIFSDFTLTTDACYAYGRYSNQLCGSAMDYATGDAYLVGHTILDQGEFEGFALPMTFGFYANDPSLSSVPAPAALWLFVSGLLFFVRLGNRTSRSLE